MEKTGPSFSPSSGDIRLDRRYGRAEAALAQGDRQEAIELLQQTLAEAPGFAAAWHLYGRALATPEHHGAAAEAWRHYLTLDPADHLGASLDLASIGAIPAEQATPKTFARALFDAYAERFEAHLVDSLHYDAPARIRDALLSLAATAGTPARFRHAADLGCGTGLMGAAVRDLVDELSGCDLSPRMVARAAEKRHAGCRLYDTLATADAGDFLALSPAAGFDLVLAADVFIYLAALRPVLAGTAHALRPGGLFAFSVQSHAGNGVVVGPDRRFAHAEPWLRDALAEAGLTPLSVTPHRLRLDRGTPVPGLIVVARR
ncbi:methyltransferase [Bosea sp. TWI1241]|uniref:class I SAM-dependent DNA methyltransferase n=1 Tax=Bosea sp. TWI1241 TaxID=3148904 RepID=UPI003209B35C